MFFDPRKLTSPENTKPREYALKEAHAYVAVVLNCSKIENFVAIVHADYLTYPIPPHGKCLLSRSQICPLLPGPKHTLGPAQRKKLGSKHFSYNCMALSLTNLLQFYQSK
jgi:hypothetical protein